MGLGFARFYDPQASAQIAVVGQFIGLPATLVFLSRNGHLLLISTLVPSFQSVPPAARARRAASRKRPVGAVADDLYRRQHHFAGFPSERGPDPERINRQGIEGGGFHFPRRSNESSAVGSRESRQLWLCPAPSQGCRVRNRGTVPSLALGHSSLLFATRAAMKRPLKTRVSPTPMATGRWVDPMRRSNHRYSSHRSAFIECEYRSGPPSRL